MSIARESFAELFFLLICVYLSREQEDSLGDIIGIDQHIAKLPYGSWTQREAYEGQIGQTCNMYASIVPVKDDYYLVCKRPEGDSWPWTHLGKWEKRECGRNAFFVVNERRCHKRKRARRRRSFNRAYNMETSPPFFDFFRSFLPARRLRMMRPVIRPEELCPFETRISVEGGFCSWRIAPLLIDPHSARGFLQCIRLGHRKECGLWTRLACIAGTTFSDEHQACLYRPLEQGSLGFSAAPLRSKPKPDIKNKPSKEQWLLPQALPYTGRIHKPAAGVQKKPLPRSTKAPLSKNENITLIPPPVDLKNQTSPAVSVFLSKKMAESVPESIEHSKTVNGARIVGDRPTCPEGLYFIGYCNSEETRISVEGGFCSWRIAPLLIDPHSARGFLQCIRLGHRKECGLWTRLACIAGTTFSDEHQACLYRPLEQGSLGFSAAPLRSKPKPDIKNKPSKEQWLLPQALPYTGRIHKPAAGVQKKPLPRSTKAPLSKNENITLIPPPVDLKNQTSPAVSVFLSKKMAESVPESIEHSKTVNGARIVGDRPTCPEGLYFIGYCNSEGKCAKHAKCTGDHLCCLFIDKILDWANYKAVQ